jgi:hypothetical protein
MLQLVNYLNCVNYHGENSDDFNGAQRAILDWKFVEKTE